MAVETAALADRVFTLFGGGIVQRFADATVAAHLDVVSASDSPGLGVTSWATVGARAFETGLVLADGRSWRVELLAVADTEAAGVGALLAQCALSLLDAPSPVAAGAVLPGVVATHVPDTTTPHALLVEPVSWPDPPADLDAPDEVVEFLQVVPVSDAELDLVRRDGVAALVERFGVAQPLVADLRRASAV